MRSVRYGCPGRSVLWLVLVVTATLLPYAGCGLPTAISATGSLRGDVNDDGVVDQADLDLATEAFGRSEGDPLFVPAADLNGDGVVGLDDLQALVTILNTQGSAVGT